MNIKKIRLEYQICELEEQYKTLQFAVNDAEWTLKNTPLEMEKLKAQIEGLNAQIEKLKEGKP